MTISTYPSEDFALNGEEEMEDIRGFDPLLNQ
jgi:hypothetical protein